MTVGLASAPARLGCYGLRLDGLVGAERLLARVPDDAPPLRLRPGAGRVDVDEEVLGRDRAVFRLQGGGHVEVTREDATAVFHMADAASVDAEHMVHPYMSTAAATMNRWHGRDSFHAGAFVAGDGAWVVLGDKGQGKSTLLGSLALLGRVVLTDDLVVLDGGDVLSGPACVDLRPDAAAALGHGEPLGVVGARERARLVVRNEHVRAPLRGWVFPVWEPDVCTRRLPPSAVLPRLLGNLSLRVPPLDPGRFLRYAALPAVQLGRPRSWGSARSATDALLTAVS